MCDLDCNQYYEVSRSERQPVSCIVRCALHQCRVAGTDPRHRRVAQRRSVRSASAPITTASHATRCTASISAGLRGSAMAGTRFLTYCLRLVCSEGLSEDDGVASTWVLHYCRVNVNAGL